MPSLSCKIQPAVENNFTFASYVTARPLDILLVEDNEADALLTRLALDGAGMPYRLRTLRKGGEVLPALRVDLQKSTRSLPDVLMLDLGMPGTNGFDILEEIAAAPAAIRAVPIIILTGYGNFDYLQKTNALWIAAYLQKPCRAGDMQTVLNAIKPVSHSPQY